MTIVALSNLFNLLTQLHPDLKGYHFGWRSDVNRSVQNNFDPENQVGNLYPRVHCQAALTGEATLEDAGEQIDVTLYFDDLLHYGNDGQTLTDTSLEQWNKLKTTGIQFLKAASKLGMKLAPVNGGAQLVNKGRFRWGLDSNLYADRLITCYFRFTVFVKIECPAWTVTDEMIASVGYNYPPAANEDYENTYEQGA
ncbi:MAG: hypothetical protein HC874_14290 [Richelia sp. SL_2_1]|nr:hypothetical protein [Richelia sp. SL_2_1]